MIHCLKLQQEKEDAFKRRYKLEEDIISKQNLEMELAQLRGKLEVMKHMGAEADTSSKELEKISEELKEKDEQLTPWEMLTKPLLLWNEGPMMSLNKPKKNLYRYV